MILMNLLIRHLVVRPVHQMSDLAEQMRGEHVELATVNAQIRQLEEVANRGDELGESARALQRMAREACEREERLRQEVRSLRIEIDQSTREREVGQIVESEFFHRIQDRAARMRRPDPPANQPPPAEEQSPRTDG